MYNKTYLPIRFHVLYLETLFRAIHIAIKIEKNIPSTEGRVVRKKLNSFVCLFVCMRSKVKGQKNKSKETSVPHTTSDSFQQGVQPIRFLEGRDDVQSDFEEVGVQRISLFEGRG